VRAEISIMLTSFLKYVMQTGRCHLYAMALGEKSFCYLPDRVSINYRKEKTQPQPGLFVNFSSDNS